MPITAKVILKNIPNKRMGRQAMTVAWHATAGHWHRNMLLGHFENTAYQRYGARRRTSKYNRAKLREHGHTKPLVFSGLTRRLAMVRDIRSTSNWGKAILHTNALNFRPEGWPNTMREELDRTTVRERRRLGKEFVRHFERRMNELQKG